MLSQDKLKKDLADCLTMIGQFGDCSRKLLVALSGGTDSTALFVALHEIASSSGFHLQACHINHGLRGQESEADALFCQELCESLGIECELIPLQLVPTTAGSTGKENHFSEEILRQKRYQSLIDVAHKKGISFIFTAHTLDDQAETILFRFFRGTSLTGLTGMETCRQLDKNLYLLRPWLGLRKADCVQFLQARGIKARHDSSNEDEIYTRNYLRHKVLPVIDKRFPNFVEQLDSLRKIILAEDELLEKLSEQLLERLEFDDKNCWSIERIKNEPLALQRRVIGLALHNRNIAISFARIDEIVALLSLKSTSGQRTCLNLSKDWRVRYSDGALIWQKIILQRKNNLFDHFQPIEINEPGIQPVLSLGLALSVELYKGNFLHNPKAEQSFPAVDAGEALVDLSKIKWPLIIRRRQPGDIIRPLGMTKTVKLKKYLHTHKNKKIVSSFVYADILLADREEVLWLPGIGLSEKIKVNGSPSHRLNWLKVQDCDLAIS